MGDDRSTNAIPTGVWVRRELVDALRGALPDSYRPGMYVALHDAARSVVDAVETEDEPKMPMTDLTDAETAWKAWQPKPERHWTVAKTAFLAGFAAASGPWAEQLDAAKAEVTRLRELAHENATAFRDWRRRAESAEADLAAALARNAELEAEVRRQEELRKTVRVKYRRQRDDARAELDNLRNWVNALADEVSNPPHNVGQVDRQWVLHRLHAAIVRGSDEGDKS